MQCVRSSSQSLMQNECVKPQGKIPSASSKCHDIEYQDITPEVSGEQEREREGERLRDGPRQRTRARLWDLRDPA